MALPDILATFKTVFPHPFVLADRTGSILGLGKGIGRFLEEAGGEVLFRDETRWLGRPIRLDPPELLARVVESEQAIVRQEALVSFDEETLSVKASIAVFPLPIEEKGLVLLILFLPAVWQTDTAVLADRKTAEWEAVVRDLTRELLAVTEQFEKLQSELLKYKKGVL